MVKHYSVWMMTWIVGYPFTPFMGETKQPDKPVVDGVNQLLKDRTESFIS